MGDGGHDLQSGKHYSVSKKQSLRGFEYAVSLSRKLATHRPGQPMRRIPPFRLLMWLWYTRGFGEAVPWNSQLEKYLESGKYSAARDTFRFRGRVDGFTFHSNKQDAGVQIQCFGPNHRTCSPTNRGSDRGASARL